MAHELGHAAIQPHDPEADADSFAEEFLMPGEDIRPSLVDAPLGRIMDLSGDWGVTPMSLARRAKDLRAITGVHFRELRAQLLRSHEPRNVA